MTTKIKTITIGIGVSHVTEATRWYQTLLGNVEMVEPAPGTIELQLTENVWLQLDDTGYLEEGGGSSIIRLETDDIEAKHQIVKRLVPNLGAIEVVEGVIRYFDFNDPSGNRLSYYQMG
jgi:lactoylglutathione lyase